MKISEIEAVPAIQEAARVLQKLGDRGLVEPEIASGWTRGYLIDNPAPTDIDVAYVGSVPYEEAQQHLKDVLDELNIDPSIWDIDGIWNAELAYGVKSTMQNYLLYYVDSIDSVYLAADGKLHDPTDNGFADAEAKILRLNDYDSIEGCKPTAKEEVYICLEGCRRIAKFGWSPTPESKERIVQGISQWNELSADDKQYYYQKKILGKYALGERSLAKEIYDQYGWGFAFEGTDLGSANR